MEEHKVYHIFDVLDDSLASGYIGVTSDIKRRMREHKHSGMLCSGREYKIIFSGSKEDCYAEEARLRPSEGIGFNKGVGGHLTAGNIKAGERRSVSTEIKSGQHLSIRTEFKKGQYPHNKGNGLDYILTSPDGDDYYVSCLTDFCNVNNLTPANIRKVAKGERNYHKGWKAVVVREGATVTRQLTQ